MKNYTVSGSRGRWYVSIQSELNVPVSDGKFPIDGAVGIDVGVCKHAALSDRTVYNAPDRILEKLDKKKRKLQKNLKNKQKFGSNWMKTVKNIGGVSARISRIRNDYLHKTSTDIVKNHDLIFIEDLNVKNMTRSPKGTVEKPGKNVKYGKRLNKSILDQGWRSFRIMLEYKSEWSVKKAVIPVSPAYTSQKCSQCGHISKNSRKNQNTFFCVECGFRDDADINAAKNILSAGQALLGDMGRQKAS